MSSPTKFRTDLKEPKRAARIAIVGNPNAGKTTLFNALTGSFQKVGNYAGVTVERVSGFTKIDDQPVEFIDIPGLYSLTAVSEDEKVAIGVLTERETEHLDLLVCVVDATNLERNLFLFTQIAELGVPTILALTMVDRLKGKGFAVNLEFAKELCGVDVVPIVAHKASGLDELRRVIATNLASPKMPSVPPGYPSTFEAWLGEFRERAARLGLDYDRTFVLGLLENNAAGLKSFPNDNPEFESLVENVPEQVEMEPDERYKWTASVQEKILVKTAGPTKKARSKTDEIDAVLTHRVFGLGIFVTIMYLVFQSIYTFASPLMDLIERSFQILGEAVSPFLAGNEIFQSLVVDGLISGVGGMLVFLPQILILFFFISVLEGTGYLARAAFLMDRLLGWCGLNGRAFIPLLSSFACAIPGVMAARVMPDKKSRLATILVAPLMSCSARLPVYLLLIGAFVEPTFGAFWAGFTLFAMHLLGLVVAIPIAWFLNRKMIKGKRLPFLLELPPYQLPKWKDVYLSMYVRGKIFVKTAGTIIVVMSVLIWALLSFPKLSADEKSELRLSMTSSYSGKSENFDRDVDLALQERQLERSILGRFGKFVEPVFIPAGFDWRITTSILAAFPARETVVPSLGIIFKLGGDVDEANGDLREALMKSTWPDGRPLFTPWVAAGLMIFFALCAQCMATLAAVKRETNSWKWAAFMFFYMTTLAYVGAVLVNQIGRFFS